METYKEKLEEAQLVTKVQNLKIQDMSVNNDKNKDVILSFRQEM